MARLYSCGFELRSITAGVEFDTRYTTTGLSIDTTVKASGGASLKFANTDNYIRHDIAGAAGAAELYARVRFRFDTSLPSSGTPDVLDIVDVDGYPLALVFFDSADNKLHVAYQGSDGNYYDVSPDQPSGVISADTWYRVELYIKMTNGNTMNFEAKLNGTTFCTVTGQTTWNYGTTASMRYLALYSYAGIGETVNFDDWAVNDPSGSYQNSWCGDGKIVHLNPNAAGDNTDWTPSTGANYDAVNDVPPGAAYVYSTTADQIDDYNLQSHGDAGIGDGDTISLIQVGSRFKISSTLSTDPDYVIRFKCSASGTVVESGNLSGTGSTTIRSHRTALPRIYQLTSYINPDDSEAMTPTDLDSAQVGVRETVTDAHNIQVSALWVLVEYVEWLGNPENDERSSKIIGKALTNESRSSKIHAKSSTLDYSHGSKSALPTGYLAVAGHSYESGDYTNVETDDGNRVQAVGVSTYILHQFRKKNDNNTDSISVSWNGQSDRAPSSATVYLQVYNHNTDSWETLDSESAAGANTDFTLEAEITSDLSYYYDADNWATFRVYQQP